MRKIRRTAAVLLLLAATAAQAQQMYVSDELVITLRTGPSTQNTVTANLQSGDIVEVLEQDADAGYSHVRVADSGAEGWVLTRYLMEEETADRRLADTTQALAAARASIASLEAEIAELRATLAATQSALDAAETSHQSVSAELSDIREASANAIELRNRNNSLRQQNIELSSERDALLAEVSRLGSRSRQNWFVVGSLVLAFGIVIGLVAPSLRPQRRSKW
ncbi:MAG TPA: TIGR04211 family SH3 domain-containing protein [Gammaproteobacteria bacterium]|nr:TIGR04211 family SH3 domain-containing protein [Gammaproteobacteria bacterium]